MWNHDRFVTSSKASCLPMTTHGARGARNSRFDTPGPRGRSRVDAVAGSDGLYVDCTVGLGHTAALLVRRGGKVLARRDEHALAIAAERLGRVGKPDELVHAADRTLVGGAGTIDRA